MRVLGGNFEKIEQIFCKDEMGIDPPQKNRIKVNKEKYILRIAVY